MTALDPQVAQQNGAGPVDVMQPLGLTQVQQSLLRAIDVMATNAAAESSGAEGKDFGAAAEHFANAYVVLDPAVDQTGVPLSHQVDLERVKQDGALRLEQARSQQNAPDEKKRRRKLRVTRDNDGRVTGAEEED